MQKLILKYIYLLRTVENSNTHNREAALLRTYRMSRGKTACHNVADRLPEIIFCSASYALTENII